MTRTNSARVRTSARTAGGFSAEYLLSQRRTPCEHGAAFGGDVPAFVAAGGPAEVDQPACGGDVDEGNGVAGLFLGQDLQGMKIDFGQVVHREGPLEGSGDH